MPVVLVVEDDEDLLQALIDALASEGWTTVGTTSSIAALEIARSRKVDIVLADVNMPDGDGLDLEVTFQAEPRLSSVPFVFMTGLPPEAGHMTGRPLLLKPFDVGEASACLRLACIERIGRRRQPHRTQVLHNR